jgi:hypothetical protein
MKRLVILIAVLLVGLLIGVCLGLALTVPRKVGMSEVTVKKQSIDGHDVLLVYGPEHPPWAQQHLTSVEFDYNQKTISILRYAVTMNPGFWRQINSRWPVVIRDGLLPGDYTLQIWRGERFFPVGSVLVTENKIDYLPRKDEP